MIVVHHLNNSRSQRVLWLLEELGLDYEIRRYERDPATMEAPASLKAVHPLGKSPVITDGDVTVAETGAIVDYILERYGEGRLVPAAGTPERLRWRYWMHYAEGSAMPLLVMKLVLMRAPDRTPALIRPLARKITGAINAGFVDPRLNTNLAFWEAELARGPWFAGPDFTTADIMMSFPAEVSAQRIEGARNATRVQDFVKRIHARPAFRRALERGGAYAYAD